MPRDRLLPSSSSQTAVIMIIAAMSFSDSIYERANLRAVTLGL